MKEPCGVMRLSFCAGADCLLERADAVKLMMLEAPVRTTPLLRLLMLSTITSPLALVLLALTQTTEAPNKSCITSRAFGKTYKSCVDENSFRSSPAWNREKQSSPPVSPRKAVQVAEKMRKAVANAPDGWKWELMNLNLTFREDDHCAWLVMFQAIPALPEDEQRFPLHEITLVVLMDGTAIEPTVGDDEEPAKKIPD